MAITVIDFDTLSRRKRKKILRQSVKDMQQVAIRRGSEGMKARLSLLQGYNEQQMAKLS